MKNKMTAILVLIQIALQGFSVTFFAFSEPLGTNWKSELPNVLSKAEPQFPQTNWWEVFQDPTLNQLIQTALKNNPSLKAVKTQIAAAEAISKSYRAPLMPSVTFDPQYNYNVYGVNQFIFPISSRRFESYQTPFNVSYEVDLFGKNLATYHSSKKQIDVAHYQFEVSQIQLASLVAASYFNVAKWRQLESLAKEQLDASDKLLKHSKGLLELGQATIFDIQNEQQRRDQSEVNVTQFSANRQVAENQLIALLGENPNTKSLDNITSWENLQWPAVLDVGVPSLLIVHRPDVAVAEAQLAAADLDIEAARKAFLPSLLLSGSTGFNAVGAQNLFKWTSVSSFFGAILSQAIFDGGRRRAELDLRRDFYEQILDNYQNSIINAFTDAENSLAILRADQIVYQNLTRQTEAARQKVFENKSKFDIGLQGEPAWLAAQVERLEYEKALTQQKVQMLIDVVGVAKAMGGGFQAPQVSKR